MSLGCTTPRSSNPDCRENWELRSHGNEQWYHPLHGTVMRWTEGEEENGQGSSPERESPSTLWFTFFNAFYLRTRGAGA